MHRLGGFVSMQGLCSANVCMSLATLYILPWFISFGFFFLFSFLFSLFFCIYFTLFILFFGLFVNWYINVHTYGEDGYSTGPAPLHLRKVADHHTHDR